MPYEDYVGRSLEKEDETSAALGERLAALFDLPPPPPEAPLFPLSHWCLFQDWVRHSELGPDGHPARGAFLPPIHDLPRRMWAGGRIVLHAPLRPGLRLTRRTTIRSVTEKQGHSGRLVFVTLHHRIAAGAQTLLEEEQDIVYRGLEAPAVKAAAPAPPPPAGAFQRTLTPDPVLLFRYSAITGNGHRIHYDLDYVRTIEGYPGLIVHGPLQASLLADLLFRHLGATPERLTLRFRGVRPAFHGRPLTLIGWAEGENAYHLEARDDEGAVTMAATAQIHSAHSS
jgi:3-methylfumaryl-CoA hydratase